MNNFKSILVSSALLIALMSTDAQTQGDMDSEASSDFQKIDKRLNSAYNKILSTLDDQSKEKLKASERAWLVYREAQARFEADVVARGGTMSPVIYNECRVSLTDTRIKELQKSVSVR